VHSYVAEADHPLHVGCKICGQDACGLQEGNSEYAGSLF
jgi:hypothetical protein